MKNILWLLKLTCALILIVKRSSFFSTPDESLPAARANPPPKRRMTPHGIFFSIRFQVTNAGEAVIGSSLEDGDERKSAMKFGEEGMMKRRMAISTAGVASLLP